MHLYPQRRATTSRVVPPGEWMPLLSQGRVVTPPVAQSQQRMYLPEKRSVVTSSVTQSQQQMYLPHPQCRVVTSPMAQSQQQMYLSRQSCANTSPVAQSQQQTYLPQQHLRTSRVAQSQEGMYSLRQTMMSPVATSQQSVHIHSQGCANGSPFAQSQPQLGLHPQARPPNIPDLCQSEQQLIGQLKVQPSASLQVAQSQRHVDSQPHERHGAFLLQQHMTARQHVPVRTAPAFETRQHYSLPINVTSRAGDLNGPLGTDDASSNQLRGLLRGKNQRLKNYLKMYFDIDSPGAYRDSRKEGFIRSPTHTGQNRVANSMISKPIFVSQPASHAQHPSHLESRVRSPTLDASSEDAATIGDCGGYAVDHEAFPIIVAVHSAGVHKKIDAFSPGISQTDTAQDADDVIITGVTLRGSLPVSPTKRSSSQTHAHDQPKRICLQEKCSSPHEHLPRAMKQCEQMPGQQGVRSQEFNSPDNMNSPGPLTPAEGYLSAQEFFESHNRRAASSDSQASFTFPAAADTELDFGGPPPYLPLREPLEGKAPECCGSSDLAAAPQQPVVSGTTGISPNSSESQTQIGPGTPELTRKSTTSLDGSNEAHSDSSSNREYTLKATKHPNTLESLCGKILHTRERIKHEEIPWKKKVLYRLETMFMKKLVKMEEATGTKACIDIPREELAKKMAKRRNSRFGSNESEPRNLSGGKTKSSSNGNERKENGAVEEPPANRPKAPVDYSEGEVDITGSTDSQKVEEQNEVRQKLDEAPKPSGESQPQVDVGEKGKCTKRGADLTSNKQGPEQLAGCSSKRTEKSAEIKRAVIKPYSHVTNEGTTKHQTVDENGKLDNPKELLAEKLPSDEGEDTPCKKLKPEKKCFSAGETPPVHSEASTAECNRNIWSVLKTFSM